MIKVIAEIGINHHGSFKKTLNLIDIAKDSGCWGVKFQYRSENFFSTNDEMGSTLIRSELKKSNFKEAWIDKVISKCQKEKIKIGMSFFRVEDLERFFKNGRQIDFIKIPSPEFRNMELIKKSKELCPKLIISYGAGEESEIKECIKKSKLRKDDCTMHCISNYPTSSGNQQMSFLKKMKGYSKSQIGYSSHDEDWEIAITSFQYGIDYIERHLCESKDEVGLDISTSSDSIEFKKLVKISQSYDKIILCEKRIPNQGEILNARNLGASLYYKRDYNIGDKIDLHSLEEKSPATGLKKDDFLKIKKNILIRNKLHKEPVQLSDFLQQKKVDSKMRMFIEKNQISLPVRLHDFQKIRNRFGSRFFELHLSYAEVGELYRNKNYIKSNIDSKDIISIHLPDYIDKDNLIDPFSKNEYVKKESLFLINACINAAKEIEVITKSDVKILGSFSVIDSDKNSFYFQLSEFFKKIYINHKVEIIAQWLPKKAWYFGGSVTLNVFCEPEDILYVKKYNIPICLDISHLILSANFFEEDWEDWLNKLVPFAKHIHLSDGEGISGEGVEFGKGDLKNIKNILKLKLIKVLEVWEGHHDNGEKFFQALEYLDSK